VEVWLHCFLHTDEESTTNTSGCTPGYPLVKMLSEHQAVCMPWSRESSREDWIVPDCNCRVVRRQPDVSEEHFASVFRVAEYDKKPTGRGAHDQFCSDYTASQPQVLPYRETLLSSAERPDYTEAGIAGALSTGVERPGFEADCLPPYSVQFTNMLSCMSRYTVPRALSVHTGLPSVQYLL
jgi:hypothetical protein